ncbi:MAG: conjugal transfer protein TraR [Pseudonocardia sp.]|jgi:DnaK suppressor protein|nr:conjugal transfer protein TraR [Pseudonocardia sp.]
MDRRRAKKLLTDQLAELDEREGWARSDSGQQLPEPGALSQHPADYGSDLANEMERELMVQTISRERQQILDALQRIEDGTYGRCSVDGEPIDDARLEARPEAEMCLRHQEEAERHGLR